MWGGERGNDAYQRSSSQVQSSYLMKKTKEVSEGDEKVRMMCVDVWGRTIHQVDIFGLSRESSSPEAPSWRFEAGRSHLPDRPRLAHSYLISIKHTQVPKVSEGWKKGQSKL